LKIKRIINEFRLIKALLLVGLFLLMSGKGWGQTATATNNGPVCLGLSLNLVGGPDGMTNYAWSGPNGFTSSEQNPTVSINATLAMAGDYTLTINGIPTATTTVIVNALPVVNFITQPGANTCIGSNVIYTTEDIMTNYVWGFPGTLDTDYIIISGGTITSNTVTIRYLTTGTRTVTINYTNSLGCTATLATSSTATTINPLPTTSAIYHQ
jgi:hypothetical protein